jgi:hypothetical protein
LKDIYSWEEFSFVVSDTDEEGVDTLVFAVHNGLGENN